MRTPLPFRFCARVCCVCTVDTTAPTRPIRPSVRPSFVNQSINSVNREKFSWFFVMSIHPSVRPCARPGAMTDTCVLKVRGRSRAILCRGKTRENAVAAAPPCARGAVCTKEREFGVPRVAYCCRQQVAAWREVVEGSEVAFGAGRCGSRDWTRAEERKTAASGA